MTTMAPFRATLPLEPGITLVEASAGTGKTHGITDLVLRLVVEHGLPIDRILVVTYTRAATAELKQRVRQRLVEARELLASLVERRGSPPAPTGRLRELVAEDEVMRLLTSPGFAASSAAGWRPAARTELGQRLGRLSDAVRDFDAAPISTIHGFCQEVLRARAFESHAVLGAELLEDTGGLLEEIVDDFLSAALHAVERPICDFLVEQCRLERTALLALARAATGNMDATIEPEVADWPEALGLWQAARERFAERWRGAEGRELREWLASGSKGKPGFPALDGRVYQGKRTANNSAKLEAALAAPVPDADWYGRDGDGKLTAWVRYFTADQLAASMKSAGTVPPLCAEWQRLVEHAHWLADAPRVMLARRARSSLAERLAARGALTFDALLRQVRDALLEQGPDGALARALRERYGAALIDEFQDTDGVQWPIFETAFARAGSSFLFLIGDPKQAIYRFRGADIEVYAEAKHSAPQALTMEVNQRSDGRYVAALNGLLAVAPDPFDEPFIGYVPVRAAARNEADRLRFPAGRAPIELRWLDSATRARPAAPLPAPGDGRKLSKEQALRRIPELVVAEARALLAAGATVAAGAAAAVDGVSFRPLHPGDLAVLVRKHRQAHAVHRALRAAGIAAIVAGAGSVLDSDEARAVGLWLDALAAPDRQQAIRRLALSALVGWTACELARAARSERGVEVGEPDAGVEWRELTRDVGRWARELGQRGFHAALRRALDERAVLERLGALPDGERRLTDLRHVMELLHVAEVSERLDAAGLGRWLRARQARGDLDDELAELRLESDESAVKVTTLHKAKGLQYPIVLLPYAWDAELLQRNDVANLLFHSPGRGRRGLHLDLRLDAKDAPKREHVGMAKREALRESVRLLYVGLTRARHHAVLWWGPVKGVGASALGSVLHGGHEPAAGEHEPSRGARAKQRIELALGEGDAEPNHRLLLDDLAAIAGRRAADGRSLVGWSRLPPAGAPATEGPPEPERPAFSSRPFGRRGLDAIWRRLSYTLLSKPLHPEAGAELGGPGLGRAEAPAATRGGAQLDLEGRDYSDGAEPAAVAIAAAELAPPAAVAEAGEPPPEAGPAPEAEVPLGPLPGGVETGKWIHELLELLDFRTCHEKGGSGRSLALLAASIGRRIGVTRDEDHRLVTAHLPTVLQTPLGGALGELRLQDLAPGDRLDELGFDLPVRGGSAWRGGDALDGGRIGEVLAARGDDLLPQSFLGRLERLRGVELAGLLTGSIDLAFRVRADGTERWFVCDYKTNRLAEAAEPGTTARGRSTPGCYRPERLRVEMDRHAYFLQYHLYLVALHRLLASRLGASYRYQRHVGGAVYLFVRGMTGATTPRASGQSYGVFFDRPPEAVIEQLSELLGAPGGAP